MAHATHAKTLPADLGAPAFVDVWKTRALIVGVVFSVIAAGLAFADGSIDHVLRAWLHGIAHREFLRSVRRESPASLEVVGERAAPESRTCPCPAGPRRGHSA